MSPFKKGLLWGSAPWVLGVVSLVGQVTHPRNLEASFGALWALGVATWLATLIVAIIFAASGKKQKAAGMFIGAGLGVVALGASCFAAFRVQ